MPCLTQGGAVLHDIRIIFINIFAAGKEEDLVPEILLVLSCSCLLKGHWLRQNIVFTDNILNKHTCPVSQAGLVGAVMKNAQPVLEACIFFYAYQMTCKILIQSLLVHEFPNIQQCHQVESGKMLAVVMHRNKMLQYGCMRLSFYHSWP